MLVRTVTSSQAREALDDVGSPQIPTGLHGDCQ